MSRMDRILARLRGREGGVPAVADTPRPPLRSQEYWSQYNVTEHRTFASREESLRWFHWRTEQYYDYLRYMPVSGQDGKVVLDYGCGPGHDLVGFSERSKPARLVGIDVSKPSLEEAAKRLALHAAEAELLHVDEDAPRLPLPDASVDHVHSSGVLHHVPDPVRVLRELRRVLRPDGRMRLMIYNRDCIWFHLFSAYTVRFTQNVRAPAGGRLTVEDAFRRSTDTADCPISHAWTPADVAMLAAQAGFRARHLGNAVSVREVAILPERFDAILDPELEDEHRRFLLGLTFDARGVPFSGEHAAGIDGCYELAPDASATRGAVGAS